jgi:hypothetical protein
VAPVSGALLDVDWSANPTIDADELGFGWVLAAVAASGLIYPLPGGIEVPPGVGLCLVANAAIAVPAGDVTFTWLEDW